MKPRRYLYSWGGNAAALVLLLRLCLTSLFLLLLHGSSPSLEVAKEKAAAAAAAAAAVGVGQEVVVQAEVEEALLLLGNARVAFLFIVRNRLPLDLVWDAFFRLVFPSSAAVYGSPKNSPCIEEFPLTPNNPYGKTKLVVEGICRDIYRTDPKWKINLLRYFNPVGAYPNGYLGEDPCGIPNNLMPFVQQVAVGRRPAPTILGNDYATRDGTGLK